MAEIQKGFISTIEGPADSNGNSTRARVVPEQADGVISKPLVIPAQLRGNAGKLAKGTEVVFAIFPDQTGIILSRADGEWYGVIYGNETITGALNVGGKVTAKDVKTDTLSSVNSHKHGGVEPGTGTTGAAQN